MLPPGSQGDEDQVVPPNQAVIMHEALAKRGVPTALVMFKGEQHGFRSAPNIRAAMDGEFYFYGKVRVLRASPCKACSSSKQTSAGMCNTAHALAATPKRLPELSSWQ